jgi:hypothetical protein
MVNHEKELLRLFNDETEMKRIGAAIFEPIRDAIVKKRIADYIRFLLPPRIIDLEDIKHE